MRLIMVTFQIERAPFRQSKRVYTFGGLCVWKRETKKKEWEKRSQSVCIRNEKGIVNP